jgi:hypothetical protein
MDRLFIAGMATTGPVETFDQAWHWRKTGALFLPDLYQCTLVTVFATMLMAGIYVYLRTAMHGWPAIAFALCPLYAALNLFSYLSQITLLPYLADLTGTSRIQRNSAVFNSSNGSAVA